MQKNKTSLKWILESSKNQLANVAILTFLSIAMSFVGVKFAIVSKNVVDIATKTMEGSLSRQVIIMCLFIAFQILIHILYTYAEVNATCVLTNNIQRKVFKNVLGAEYLCSSSYHSGDLLNRIENDVNIISASVMSLIPTCALLIGTAVFSIYELYHLDAGLTLACVIAFPFVAIVSKYYGKKMKGLHKESRQSTGKILSYIQETISNLLPIKAFVKENLATRLLSDLQEKNRVIKVKTAMTSIFANLLFFSVMTFAYYIALIWCARKVYIGIMTIGTLTAILQLVGRLQEPFREFSSVISTFYSMLASAERVIEIENMPKDIYAPAKSKTISKIVFDNVTFSYDNKVVLKNASASIDTNSLVAICGESGVGKSTLMELAMGILKPDEGIISVYDENGISLNMGQVRNSFAYVPQGNMVFSGTVMDNITFMEENPDREKATECARIACMIDFISELDDGFETVLGEGGLGLSVGQVQRLAIARALYAQKSMLFLDESTSALDSETEARLIENIKTNPNLSVFMITHRKELISHCDKVIYIKNGCIHIDKNNQ